MVTFLSCLPERVYGPVVTAFWMSLRKRLFSHSLNFQPKIDSEKWFATPNTYFSSYTTTMFITSLVKFHIYVYGVAGCDEKCLRILSYVYITLYFTSYTCHLINKIRILNTFVFGYEIFILWNQCFNQFNIVAIEIWEKEKLKKFLFKEMFINSNAIFKQKFKMFK